MIWVSWRLQRTETLVALGILILLAALLIPTGIEMASGYQHDGLSACLAPSTSSGCDLAIESFTARFNQLDGLVGWFNLLPGLIGVLLAAPFLLEFEQGTYKLSWTQSVTRARWITTKLALTVGAALLAAGGLTLLVTWWRTPLDQLHGRMSASAYDFEGSVTLGYTLFALGLSLALGVIWRRTVPALVTAYVGYVAARLFVDNWLRQRFEPAVTTIWANGARFTGPDLRRAWVFDEEPTNRLGHTVNLPLGLVGTCSRAISSQVRTISGSCLAHHGDGYTRAVYQPASRFWTFQGIETGLFGGTALALVVLAAWWTHNRTA